MFEELRFKFFSNRKHFCYIYEDSKINVFFTINISSELLNEQLIDYI